MLLNHFKIAFRTLLKFKGYAFINLLGLALGLTAGILIMIYVLDETSYDTFHAKGDRLYRVTTAFYASGDEKKGGMDQNGWPIGRILAKDFPEVESVIYTRNGSFLTVNHDDKRFRQNVHFMTPEFLSMFSFPLVKGNPDKALTEPYTAIITEDMEKKFFNGDALNKTLIMVDTLNVVVTGVLKNVPTNSHMQFDILLSFSTFEALDSYFSFDSEDGWGNINMRNYVLLKEGADAQAFAKKAENLYMERAGEMMKSWGTTAHVGFEPMNDIYLKSKSGNGMGSLGSIDRLYLLSGIASFVILLACINFVNLATARSVYRAKEVGLRKVAGSTRQGLIRQFLSESFVLTVLSLFIAIALTGLFLPFFNQLLGKNYQMLTLTNFSIVSGIAILVVIVSLFAGYYPAMIMSALKPAEVLKGKMQSSARGIQLRRSLVVFQFVISAILVVGTLIVLDQLKYMQQQELGFEKNEIMVINSSRARSSNPEAFETLKQELKKLAVVGNVSMANSLPGNPGWQGQVSYPEGKTGEDAVSVEYMAIDEDYLNTLGLKLIAGSNFDKSHAVDMEEGLILNESAVIAYGWLTPQEAIGKKIVSPSETPAGRVIGVVKNYHQLGLQQKIRPMVMDYFPTRGNMYAIRYKASDTQHLISSVQNIWTKTFPGYDFNYFFLDQDFEKQYQSEQRLANVFTLFAVITIVIAVIGLIGLVSFMVVARTKEIGVRKVLGAGVFSITRLLSKEFIVLVIVANVISIPIAWYFASQWLQKFAYRTALNPMLFVWTALIAITITLLAVGYQTVRAATSDPVKSLRYE
jgi:putative ABC transport system permease protein